MEEKLQQIEDFLKSNIKPNFDFDVEYWDSGNYDDAYQYGTEVGEQNAYETILAKLQSLK